MVQMVYQSRVIVRKVWQPHVMVLIFHQGRNGKLTVLVEQKLKSFNAKLGLNATTFPSETKNVLQQKRSTILLKKIVKQVPAAWAAARLTTLWLEGGLRPTTDTHSKAHLALMGTGS